MREAAGVLKKQANYTSELLLNTRELRLQRKPFRPETDVLTRVGVISMPYLSAGEINSLRRCRKIYSEKDNGVLLLRAPARADRSACREYSPLTENVKN